MSESLIFLQFWSIPTGFSREGRSWAKGNRKNTRIKKYTMGCHGNLKFMLSGHISPEKHGITLAAYFSGVYGPTTTRLSLRVEGMWAKLTEPLVSMVAMLLLCKLENALTVQVSA